jgi:excisionase family DNA binding protein
VARNFRAQLAGGVNEVATLLSVSERQVYKLAAEHGIPYFRIGGSIRFDPVAVANWLRLKMCAAVAVSISDGGQRA